jgi:hypothetical protein
LKAGDIIYADTRYDVDHGNNGKWMPYASSLAEWKTRANKLADIKANRRLMFKVMKHAKIQLHQGKHSGSQDFGVGEMPYKECVRKYLDKINQHALSHYKKKPPCDDCKGKQQAGKYPPETTWCATWTRPRPCSRTTSTRAGSSCRVSPPSAPRRAACDAARVMRIAA